MARVAVRASASSCCATTLPSLKPTICVVLATPTLCSWSSKTAKRRNVIGEVPPYVLCVLLSDVCLGHLKLTTICDNKATFSPPVPNLCLNHRAFTVESAERELQKSDGAFFHQQLQPKPLLCESGVVTPDSSVMPPSESEIVQGMLGRGH